MKYLLISDAQSPMRRTLAMPVPKLCIHTYECTRMSTNLCDFGNAVWTVLYAKNLVNFVIACFT